MKTQQQFIAERLAAHAAGTQDISKDPLVQAAMEAQRQAAEVMKRWKEMRDAQVDPTATGVFRRTGPRAGRQAE